MPPKKIRKIFRRVFSHIQERWSREEKDDVPDAQVFLPYRLEESGKKTA